MTARPARDRSARLVEVLVVVIVLGVLATVVAPQFLGHTDDGRLATLDASLTQMRNAIELYYHQHDSTYPGERDSSDPACDSTAPAIDFEKQLTLYTDAAGRTSEAASDSFRFGPYLRKGRLPVNPFTGTNTLATGDAAEPDGATAWKFALPSGRFAANDADPTHSGR